MAESIMDGFFKNRKEYWRKISEKVSVYLGRFGIRIIDIYLVGSSIEREFMNIHSNNDVDSVIILKGQYSLDMLKRLKKLLDKYICTIDNTGIYHFKIFNEREIELLGKYDGFRLYEFQKKHIALYGEKRILKYTPIINWRNFSNSISIQMVHDYFIYGIDVREMDNRNCKVVERIQRNRDIMNNLNIKHEILEKDVVEYCKKHDKMIKIFLENIIIERKDKKYIYWYISRYIKRYRHEYICNYDIYFERADEIINEKGENWKS